MLGVSVKVITGDTRLVALHLAQRVGLTEPRVLTGADLDQLHDEELWREAERTNLFVEVDPNQKERIILSLRWSKPSTWLAKPPTSCCSIPTWT